MFYDAFRDAFARIQLLFNDISSFLKGRGKKRETIKHFLFEILNKVGPVHIYKYMRSNAFIRCFIVITLSSGPHRRVVSSRGEALIVDTRISRVPR
jgi:hypothetical protein